VIGAYNLLVSPCDADGRGMLTAVPSQKLLLNDKGQFTWVEAQPPSTYWQGTAALSKIEFDTLMSFMGDVGKAYKVADGIVETAYSIQHTSDGLDQDAQWNTYAFQNRENTYEFPDDVEVSDDTSASAVAVAKRYDIPMSLSDPDTAIDINLSSLLFSNPLLGPHCIRHR